MTNRLAGAPDLGTADTATSDGGFLKMMSDVLSDTWRLLALRGIAALIFGVFAVLLPGITLLWLVALFAAYAIFTGIVSIAAAVRTRRYERDWWVQLLIGLVAVAGGIAALFYPDITALTLVFIIGFTALFTGILDLVAAIRLRQQIRNEWVLAASGLLSIIFGVLVILFPGAGALALVGIIGAYAFLTGVLLLALALRARTWARTSSTDGTDGQRDVRHVRQAGI
jgi:uncharacterized membrane protein HdeD (DUF308 family)